MLKNFIEIILVILVLFYHFKVDQKYVVNLFKLFKVNLEYRHILLILCKQNHYKRFLEHLQIFHRLQAQI